MKKIITFIVFSLAMCSFAVAQSPLADFEKVKEIRLLESKRKDVKRILADYTSDNYESFSNENFDIDIDYADGESCSEEDSDAIWNVSKWKVTRIEISPNIPMKFEDIGIDSSNFQREKKYTNVNEIYVYHNKMLGIAFEVNEDEIETIFLFPSTGNYSLLCDNETAEEYKPFYTNESFFGQIKLEDREYYPESGSPMVESLTLSATEITIGCNNENNSCADSNREILVKTVATNQENDVLTYNYTVSGGKVKGNGTEVIWDLTDVEAGTYTITAGVDNGCGICSPTKTETVVIKECADCLVK